MVSALKYAGKESNPIDDISITVTDAVPFQIRLPDRQWIRSKDLSRETLIQHRLLGENDKAEFILWHPHISVPSSVAGRHESLLFRIDRDGRVIEVTLAACGYSFDDVLRTEDGMRAFAFPMSVKELEELFGIATKVERFAIITGFSCL